MLIRLGEKGSGCAASRKQRFLFREGFVSPSCEWKPSHPLISGRLWYTLDQNPSHYALLPSKRTAALRHSSVFVPAVRTCSWWKTLSMHFARFGDQPLLLLSWPIV